MRGWWMALGLFAACGTAQQVEVKVTVRASKCAAANPLATAGGRLRVTVEADGVEQTSEAPLAAKVAPAVVVPAGPARRVTIDVLDASGGVVGHGKSAPLDVGAADGALTLPVVVQPIGSFSGVESGDGCAKLAVARAGHVAIALGDGRVLVAGGYADGAGGRAYLKTTEIVDAATGAVTAGPDLNVGRAFATALRVGPGMVLVAGGEAGPTGDGAAALGSAELVDVAKGTVSFVVQKRARARHAAATIGGRHFLIGGYDRDGHALGDIEEYAPNESGFVSGPALAAARGDAAVVSVGNAGWVIGGAADLQAIPTVEQINVAGTAVTISAAGSLAAARARPLAAAWLEGKLLVAGGAAKGPAAAAATDVLTSVELFDTASGSSAVSAALLSAGRLDASAVLLAPGTLLVAGGRPDGTSAAAGTEGAELFSGAAMSVAHVANEAAFDAATAAIPGGVLVVGGNTGSGPSDRIQLYYAR